MSYDEFEYFLSLFYSIIGITLLIILILERHSVSVKILNKHKIFEIFFNYWYLWVYRYMQDL